ncbi:protein LAZ1 homolog 1 isoform X1 [Ananas comosus]|uniref:Protein LAZ1 homolog 1 isoform X1 n=1 Tax=Ananas comosus TaxID=4615 RepID=A0A6P5H2U3_ANACO|nr:protein LAZ1 homolog 1 isoform X1 [Ananas comosus]XP_020115263.1 protein LAZ1 homolog 1 isoform X1 [Ananas comosus]XP_020115264.1 protein LAZ1 homolog 1 isoform X1 [Ananas comosus]XP_020115266.1 protein LAZ1 homolog 1 isoform X1 [Ananas comosus]XP_020115267.1 protein LAZ1 homolog 1 isoform X1 [Ananas comosus]XP_020115268.1 protein LAZ1 homolog 1 isoform X1 [Ananas comosus]
MAWKKILSVLLLLLPLAESLGRSRKLLPFYLVSQSNVLSSWPILSAGVFVAVSLVLSLFLISEHLAVYNQPEEQKFLIGLILMVPVYAVESFFSLLNSNVAFICELMRDCYEAFAMYCFERYLIACLGGEERTIKLMESQTETSSSTPLLDLEYEHGVVRHPFPLSCFLRSWYLGSDFYYAVKIGIVQYMILKPICAILAIILELFGVYGEGKFEWQYGYPYLAVVLNFSQTWALYCLIQFYSATKEKLEPIKPLAKFLMFKSIVFLTWWQGVAVALLFSTGAFKGHLAQELKTGIQDYIICIEMGVAAVVHLKVFPAKPYQQGERCIRNVAVMSDYASLGAPPDPEEVRESGRLTKMHLVQPDDRERRLSFPQSVRDVVLGSGEIMVDDVRYTVSHVVGPMERGIARINETLHQISENVRQIENRRRRKSKDDSYFIPMNSWSKEFSEVHDLLSEGSFSDSGLTRKRRRVNSKFAPPHIWQSDATPECGSYGFGGSRCS